MHFPIIKLCYFIKGDNIDRKEIREELMELGDSLVIAGSKTRAKIHIHTNEPAKVFSQCRNHGIVSDQKTDDMRQQQATATPTSNSKDNSTNIQQYP